MIIIEIWKIRATFHRRRHLISLRIEEWISTRNFTVKKCSIKIATSNMLSRVLFQIQNLSNNHHHNQLLSHHFQIKRTLNHLSVMSTPTTTNSHTVWWWWPHCHHHQWFLLTWSKRTSKKQTRFKIMVIETKCNYYLG